MSMIRWLRNEIRSLIPPVIYFLIVFNLFHFTQGLMMQPQDIRYTGYIGATLGAILAGKVILVVENLPFINAFPRKPIMYNISWKFVIYGFFVLLIQVMDHTIEQYYHTKSWAIAYTHLQTMLVQPVFWGIQIYVMLYFLIFIIFSELTRVFGKPKMIKIFFG
ncbi:MAG: hypothetical protein SFW66_01915 [Gammaproteobacteria bacterium]|nr:hypothetical protein [Gammaproteobacteria bacterium]